MQAVRSDPRVLRAHFACKSDKVQEDPVTRAKYVEGKIEYDDQYDLNNVPPTAAQRYIRDGMSVHYYSIDPEVAYVQMTEAEFTTLAVLAGTIGGVVAADEYLSNKYNNYSGREEMGIDRRTIYFLSTKVRIPVNNEGNQIRINGRIEGVLAFDITLRDPGNGRAIDRAMLEAVEGRELFAKTKGELTGPDLHLTNDELKRLGPVNQRQALHVALRYSWLDGRPGPRNAGTSFERADNYYILHNRPGILGGTWPWHLTGNLGDGIRPGNLRAANNTLKLEFAPFILSGGTPAGESTTHEGKTPGLKSVDEIAATLANSGRRNIVGVAMQRLENGKQGDVMLYDGI